MSSLTAVILAFATTALIATVSSAEPPFGRHGRGSGGGPPMLDYHAERLGLDQKTLDAIHQLAEESHTYGAELREQIRECKAGLREMLSADAPDEAAILEKADVCGELRTEKHKHQLSTMLQIRSMLTPEQRAELQAIRSEHRAARFAPVLEVCGDQIEALCPGLEPGRDLHMCLRENRDQLSEDCQRALRPRRHGRSGAGPDPGRDRL